MAFLERLQILIEANAKGAIAGIAETEAATSGLNKEVSKGAGFLQRFGVQSETTGALMKAGIAGGAIAAGAAVGKFALDGVKAFADVTGEVRQFQRVTRESAQDSSRWVFAAKELGVESGVTGSLVGRMAQRIKDGTVNLDEFGIKLAKNKDGTADLNQTMLNVVDAFNRTDDATQRASMGMAVFGRGWQQLTPLLSKSRGDLEELFNQAERSNQVFDPAALERGRQYTMAMREFTAEIKGLEIELGSALIPVLTEATHSLTQFVQTADMAAKPLGGLPGLVGDFVNAATGPLNVVTGAWKGLGSAIGIGGSKTNEATAAQKRLSDATQRLFELAVSGKKGTEEWTHAQLEARDASKELERGMKAVNDALADHSRKVSEDSHLLDEQNQKYRDLSSLLDDVRQKTEDLTGKKLDEEQAHLRVDQAVQDLNVTLFTNAGDLLEVRGKTLDAEQAAKDYGDSVFNASKAAGSSTEDAKDKQVAALAQVADSLSPNSDLRRWLNEYIYSLAFGIPREITTTLLLQRGFDPTFGFPTALVGNFDSGGVIPGPEGSPQFVVAHGGETVFTPDQMQALASSGMGGGGFSVNVGQIVAPDPVSAADELVRRLRAEAFLAGM